MTNANTLWAHVIVDELARCGLRHVCIAPGSRSTPLVVQFAEHEHIEDHSIIDERSAGFFALGIAQATKEPVAILCTSGTAAANLFPAICEANAASIPLLILTADRPAELQSVGASQAMDQIHLYGTHVRAFHQVAQPEAIPKKLRYARALACRAYAQANGANPGPVHLNLPFRKPLAPVPVVENHPDAVPSDLAEQDSVALFGRPNGRPFSQISTGRLSPDQATTEAFIEAIRSAQRPIIFAGADPHAHHYREDLFTFANAIGAPIIAEPTSSLRYTEPDGSPRPEIVTAIDILLPEFYRQVEPPDLIIRIGKAPLLWSTQAWIRDHHQVEQILIGPDTEPADPDHIASRQFRYHVERLLQPASIGLAGQPSGASRGGAWATSHKIAEAAAKTGLSKLLGDQPLSTPRAWKELGEALPSGTRLFVSNSMPIRDLDVFLGQPAGPIEIYFNRGINGIDGIISTGFGIACASSKLESHPQGPTVIVTGDIAFRHDMSALMLASDMEINATIVVLDNDGGAIFDYLPIADHCDVQERHFLTSGRRSLDTTTCGPCEIWSPESSSEFRQNLTDSFDRPGVQIIHLRTDHRRDQKLRQSLNEAAANHVPS